MPYTGGVVLFGTEMIQTMTASTNTYSLSGYVPGGAGYFPSETDAADQTLKVGDDLWCVVGYSRSTVSSVPSMSAGWTLHTALDVNSSGTFLTIPLYFFNYGPSPVDAGDWSAWAPTITVSGNGGTQRLAVRPFSVRGGFVVDPAGSVAFAVSGRFMPATDTWTSTNHASLGFVYGGLFSGGGAPPNNIATPTNPYYGWTVAQYTEVDNDYGYPANRTWHGRKTIDTESPQFVVARDNYYAWWGFSIPYPYAKGAAWSIGRIAY